MSAAFNPSCSLILKTGAWSSVKNFKEYYLHKEPDSDRSNNFAQSVLS